MPGQVNTEAICRTASDSPECATECCRARRWAPQNSENLSGNARCPAQTDNAHFRTRIRAARGVGAQDPAAHLGGAPCSQRGRAAISRTWVTDDLTPGAVKDD